MLVGALAAACAGDLDPPMQPSGEEATGDETPGDPAEPDEESEGLPPILDELPPEPALVDTRLDVEGDSLVLALENLTDATATVVLGTLVENPDALHVTEDAGRVVLAAHEATEVVLSAPAIGGLERLQRGWTDARVSVQATLDDGRTWGAPVSIFVEDGRSVTPRAVVGSGVTYGLDLPPEPDRGPVRGGMFQLCFVNLVTFNGVNEPDLDFLENPAAQPIMAAGMQVIATPPNSDAMAAAFLDTTGCRFFPRVVGIWQFELSLTGRNFPVANMTITGRNSGGGVPSRIFTKTVGATGNPTPLMFTMTAGESAQLQTAYAMVIHTASRAIADLGAVVRADNLTIQFLAESPPATYHHSTRTMDVGRSSAGQRFDVAHETGHWIHLNWSSSSVDFTYCAAGDAGCTPPAADDCQRTPQGTHALRTVEWSSSAHIEGIASFFAAVAFNDVASGQVDCFFPDRRINNAVISCEAAGKILESGLTGNGPCFEWTNTIFGSVGVELDWAKMYWDFVTDGNQSFVTYLTNERNLTGLTRANRSAKIFEGLSTDMNRALRAAAIGNIQEGTAH